MPFSIALKRAMLFLHATFCAPPSRLDSIILMAIFEIPSSPPRKEYPHTCLKRSALST